MCSHVHYLINPRYHPLENFSLSPQNQKENDLRHLGNLNYILCGHFDENNNNNKTKTKTKQKQKQNKNGGTPFRWGLGKPSKMVGKRGGCHLWKTKVAILKKNIDCMVLKFTVYIRNVISFFYKPKTRWNSNI